MRAGRPSPGPAPRFTEDGPRRPQSDRTGPVVRSLEARFSALVLALLAAACTGLAVTALHQQRSLLEASAARVGHALAARLALRAAPPLVAGDPAGVRAALAEASRDEAVLAASVVGSDGGVVAAYPVPEPEPGSALRSASAAIRSGGRSVGEARLLLDSELLVDAALRESRSRLAAFGLLIVALGAAAGARMGRALAGPLHRLRTGVERFRDGDLAVRVPPRSRDEIGELTRAFNRMGESLRQQDRMRSAFGRYVSDYVVAQSLETVEGSALGGAEREVSVLFADVRRFTRLSEGMKARDVVSLLNEIFQLVSEPILDCGGTIDKFMGDSVMAYFGAPVPQADHAHRAVSAAIGIQQSMAERRDALAGAPGGVRVELGIGIHTGPVVVGNIGSERRMDFTAIGDAVNVAHRVEKLAPPGAILVSEAVQRRVRGAARLRFEGERQLAGREEPVHVYAVDTGSGAPVRVEGSAVRP